MFVIRQKRNPRSIRNGFRVMCVSDLHAGAHYGTYAGLSPWDRGLIMSQFLKSEYEREPSFDLFFGNGDMVSNEYNELRDRTSYFERIQRTCAPMLTKAGVPAYYIYANHDDMRDDEWRRITGYPKDYIVDLDDDVSFVCLDLYHGAQTPEERAWGYGAPSDMKREIYEEASEHIHFREHVFVPFCRRRAQSAAVEIHSGESAGSRHAGGAYPPDPMWPAGRKAPHGKRPFFVGGGHMGQSLRRHGRRDDWAVGDALSRI